MPSAAADTDTTFEVTAGGLSVTAPASADLGSVASDGTLTASLGEVEARDERGLLTASYTTSVESTAFTATVDEEAVQFGNENITYDSDLAVVGTGVVVCTGTVAPVGLDAVRTAMSATVASGTSSCAWTPQITVTPPLSAVAGTYTGTITHSVA